MKRILIIEDKWDIIDGIVDLLNENNYEAFYSQKSEEGIKLARDKRPDLIISDVMMPVMDGYEVVKRLKEMEETKNIPVIFLSAAADKKQVEKGYEVGVKDYIVKPYKLSEFIIRIEKVLNENQ